MIQSTSSSELQWKLKTNEKHCFSYYHILITDRGLCAKVSIKAIDQPAATVFRSIIEQTGKNFVYSSELLEDVRLTLDVHNKPLRTALEEAFKGTDIEFKIKGKNVILRRKKAKKLKTLPHTYHAPQLDEPSKDARMLDEVIVVSRLESPAVETPEIGAKKITIEDVRNTPVLLGENDVIKTIQAQPGVVEGTEGLAGMYVHGGNADENLFMLDNVPLYQVNHFAGFFSAFNPEIIRYIDFSRLPYRQNTMVDYRRLWM